jgi:hypothetical protein
MKDRSRRKILESGTLSILGGVTGLLVGNLFEMRWLGTKKAIVAHYTLESISGEPIEELVDLESNINTEWHTPSKIEKLRDHLTKEGHIISYEFQKSENSVSWIYTFKNKRSLDIWNEVTYRQGFFKISRIDPKLKYNYKVFRA